MPEVIFNGPAGRIEGRYHHSRKANSPIALVLHPHPQFGGTMNNPVTYTLFQGFVNRGFSVLRFNFRGVGRSQGEFDAGIGELADAATALDWLQATNPAASPCWVAGYSFGAWVQVHLNPSIATVRRQLLVAPPVAYLAFDAIAELPPQLVVVTGDQDRIAPAALLREQAHRWRPEVRLHVLPGVDHFYSGALQRLAALLLSELAPDHVDRA